MKPSVASSRRGRGVVAAGDREHEPRVRGALGVRQLEHAAEVEQRELAVGRDEEVAGVRIGVDLAAHEDLRGDLADELAEQAIALVELAVGVALEPGREPLAVDARHRQHARASTPRRSGAARVTRAA